MKRKHQYKERVALPSVIMFAEIFKSIHLLDASENKAPTISTIILSSAQYKDINN